MKVFNAVREKWQWFKKSDFVFFLKLFAKKAQEVARTELYVLVFLFGFLSSMFFSLIAYPLAFIAFLIVLYQVLKKGMSITYEEYEECKNKE